MKKSGLLVAGLVLVASSLLAGPVLAQANPAPPGQTDELFRSFGEKAGLVRLIDDFMVRIVADERLGPFWKDTNLKQVKTQLVDQFCVITGGPCVYKGDDMKQVHGGMKIRKSDFNALVELLQVSMDGQGIAFSAQNQLLAKLAPMHREIITVH